MKETKPINIKSWHIRKPKKEPEVEKINFDCCYLGDQFKIMYPFLLQLKIRNSSTFLHQTFICLHKPTAEITILGFLTHMKNKRQCLLKMKLFLNNISVIQARARLQISLFKRVREDILSRMDVTITTICNRFMESKCLNKKYPGFLDEIDSI